MIQEELCEEKFFPNLELDFTVKIRGNKIISLVDDSHNVWINKGELGSGSYGVVFNFLSHNKKFCDLAVKIIKSDDEFRDEEIMINKINRINCRDFLKIGVVTIYNSYKVIVMEKIDGDLQQVKLSNLENPKQVFKSAARFILNSVKCILREGYYFTDIKLENIGYKKCQDGIKFTLLDFGSFSDRNSDEYIITNSVNSDNDANDKNSLDVDYIYAICITLLLIKLKTMSENKYDNFQDVVVKLRSIENYNTFLLTEEYYETLEKSYHSLAKGKDTFIEKIFTVLYGLTKEEPDVSETLNYLDYYQ